MFVRRHLVIFLLALIPTLGALSGCSPHVTIFNPTYLPYEKPIAVEPVQGKGLIYTTAEDDNYLFNGPPTSFIGFATTLEVPLGKMTKEIALLVFKDMFKDGRQHTNALERLHAYELVFHPKVVQFSYAFDQLRNIAPQVRIVLNVKLYDKEGKVSFEKSYTGVTDGMTYPFGFDDPWERCSMTAHVVLYTLMKEAAADAYQELRKRPR